MKVRWLRPHELERERKRDGFDPVRAGERYGLSPDLALAIWERVRADATDGRGRCDTEQAQRKFHEIAARIAARDGRLRPDVGRLTRVGTEITGGPVGPWDANELDPRVPGRETLVAVEARRSRAQVQVAQAPEAADVATDMPEARAVDEVRQAMAALRDSARPEQARPFLPAMQSQARRPLDLRVWDPPTRQPSAPAAQSATRELRDPLWTASTARAAAEAMAKADPSLAARLRAGGTAGSLAAEMRRTFGAAAGDVAVTSDSTRPLAAGAEGVTIGEQVYIAPGFYDLTTTAGRERLGHEVAHVLQQRRGRELPDRLSTSKRTVLEAEADRAGRAFARGEPFAVQGRAPSRVALFKGATPAKAPAAITTTTIDLKAGGRIERKPPALATAAGGAPATPAAKSKPKEKEQLIVTYGSVQASNPFTIERNASGEAVKLVGSGKLSLPASKYLKKLDLDISLGPDGSISAKMKGSSASTIKIGGLTVQSGTLSAAIAQGQLTYALDGANLALPKNIGQGALSIQGNGDQEPAFDASLAINVPKMQPATMSFHADANGYRAQGSTGVDFKQASGSVTFGLEKVGEDKALWSAAGSVGYTSERLSGQVSVQYNADGELSGEGNLAFQIADFLTGQATVAIDKEGHVAVNGEIRPPNDTQLFPEKKVENTFFKQSVEFPIWGISIPMVGSVGLIAFIEGSLGYRVGVGAGVMRNIVLSGSYSTDPSKEPTFAITGEIFIPAFAELLISVGGGIKLSAFIAEVGGGVKVDGRAGFYGGLSVRPTLAYEGGKYRLTGQALLAGDVGLSAQVDAFVRLHVGKWMFSWEKEWDWKLAEWNKWLGLNLGMEADLDYTLGQPLSPDIFKLKKPDSIDVQDIAKSAMPQGGMPPQGAKGAQNQKAEFKQKGGGGPAAPAAAAPKPKTAGTPAGAAGHKNQDPKGKNVKPAKPPKSAPSKKAKGKGPGQTGPDPKNKSKPSEQKLDAKPIIESFSMNGEPHRLIVQLGPGGHVDMASKRERLSVKVGHAVGKLTAKKASPQQISDLKAIGAVAKNGDKMAATAKMTDKPGTTKVAQQIAAYGNKWQVRDLDEVAIKAPRTLVVTKPFRLEQASPQLATALRSASDGQVIYSKPGDPKQVTRQVLEKHKDAHFDFESAKLTLPTPMTARLSTAQSVDQLGQQLGQQTGVSKVTLKKTEQNGDTKIELLGEIGVMSTLGTIVVAVEVPKSLTISGHAKLDKPSESLGKDIGKVAGGATIWVASVTDPKQVTANLLRAHPAARFDAATKNLQLPPVQVSALGAAISTAQLGQLVGQQTGVSKVTLMKSPTGFALHGHINPETAVLEGHVPFVPIDKVAQMAGGQEHVKIVDQGGKPAIVDTAGKAIALTILDALDGPFAAPRNKTGATILNAASTKLQELTGKIGAIELKAGVTPATQTLLEEGATSVVSAVERIGTGLDVPTLHRATLVEKTAQKSLVFDMTVPGSVANGVHRANFEAEVVRQLALQQAGLNDMTLDSWAANVDTYKADQTIWITKLSEAARSAVLDEVVRRIDDTFNAALAKSAEIKEAKTNLATIQEKLKQANATYTVAQALSELTSSQYIKNNFVGRFGNEDAFRETHAAGIAQVLATMYPQWDGLKSRSGVTKDAVTHNPDQIAGGFGMLPDIAVQKQPGPGEDTSAWDAYLAVLKSYIGASKVNSRIGPGWTSKIETAYQQMKATHPKEGSYPLWRMNFVLTPSYK